MRHRYHNKPWVKADYYYVSTPAEQNGKPMQVYDNAHSHFCVLGQFYEPVSLAQLSEACWQYVKGHRKDFIEPAGSYLLLMADKQSDEVYVFTDRFGTQHAYYLSAEDNNVISTYFLGLLKCGVRQTLDKQAIAAFMAMGFFPGDKTYSEQIHILNPASCYVFSSDLKLTSAKRYWDWQYSVTGDSVNDYTGRLQEALLSTLSHSLKDVRVALPLSGGLDSRTLAGLITKENIPYSSLWSYAYGFNEDSPEINIATKIAEARTIDFDAYTVPDYLFDSMPAIIDSVELFQFVDGTRQTFMQPYIARHADYVVGGHWGDVWLDDMGLEATPKDEKDILMNAFKKKVVKKGSGKLSDAISFINDKDRIEYLESYFSDYTDRYKGQGDADFKMKIFKTDQWSFRWTLASIRAYRAAAIPVLPFYDKRVAEVCMTVPRHLLHKRALQVAYLKEYHPDLARIRWQEYDSNLYRYKYLNNRNIAYRIWKRLQRELSQEKTIVRNADVFYRSTEGRERLLSVLNNSGLEELTEPAKVNKIAEDYYNNPDGANTYAISMLHTLAQFLKVWNE